MDPLAIAGLGLNALGTVSGLLGGASAQRRAEAARQQAMNDWAAQMAAEEQSYQGDNARRLAAYTGDLNAGLESTGRSLGDAMASAGVYNSSATAGALANQAAENSASVARYGGDLAGRLAELRARNRQSLAGMRLGAANEDLGRADDRYAGGIAGAAGLLQMIPQFVNPAKPKLVDGVQSALQTGAQSNWRMMGMPDGNVIAPFQPGGIRAPGPVPLGGFKGASGAGGSAFVPSMRRSIFAPGY